jgi:SusD family.
MKKHINIYLSALLALTVIASCKKSFLDERPFSTYSPETLKDSLGFDASLVGLYNHFSNFYTRSDRQGWVSVWQVGTDIAFAASPEGVETPYFKYELLNPQDHAASWCWTWAYRLINNANIIIAGVTDPSLTSISQPTKNMIEAEARFFRGYAYNFLATLYGRVPVVTEPLAAPKTNFTRSPLDEVNKVVEDDLKFAADNLPEVGNLGANTNGAGKPAGRAHKYMAMQLLAEAYLRMGKPDLAEQRAQAIIGSNKFDLNTARYGVKASQPGDYFSDMFVKGNIRRSQGNKEAIWVMEIEDRRVVPGGFTGDPQQRRNWGTGYHNIPGMKLADSLGGRGIGRMRLSTYVLYNLYEANDMRNSQYNIRRQFWYNDPTNAKFGQPVPFVGSDTNTNIAPHTTKWYQFDPTDEFGYAMLKDITLMRLGETYLLLAEAQFKNNKPGEAAATLTTLRARSNASAVTAGQVSMDFILDERARELLAEENRRMTLMRTGTLVQRAALNANSPLNPISGLTNKHLLLPIPLSEINLNKDAELEQNPDY